MPAPVRFEIHADDPARARKFYGAVFGWDFRQADGGAIEYWLIDTREPGAMTAGLLRRQGALIPRQHPNAFVVTMAVTSLDETLAKALAAGATLAMAKMALPGVGWWAYLHDPEQNIIGIHQPDAGAK